MTSCGVVTLALGRRKYLEMAANLALSLRNSSLPISLVTDDVGMALVDQDIEIAGLFDRVVRGHSMPTGPAAKLWVNLFSPYERSVFIDADCLCYGFRSEVLDGMTTSPLTLVPVAWRKYWGGKNLVELGGQFGVERFPKINSGTFGWRKCTRSDAAFAYARELLRRDPYKFSWDLGGRRDIVNDEPLLVAGALHSGCMRLVYELFDREVMVSTLNARSFNLNVTVPRSSFVKEGKRVSPYIVHFCELFPNQHYRDDVERLCPGRGSIGDTHTRDALKRRLGRFMRAWCSSVYKYRNAYMCIGEFGEGDSCA